MMRRALLTACAAAAMLAACNRTNTLGSDRPPQTPAPDAPAQPVVSPDAAAPAEAPGPNTAAGLAARAAQSDMFEVEAGRIALQRSSDAAVRTFAQQMVDAHTASSQALRAQLTAARLEITLPADLDRPHSDMSADLRSAEASAFDDTYKNQQVQAHEEALALLQGYGRNGDNAALRAWATQQATVVQQHLEAVRGLAGEAPAVTAASGSASSSAFATSSSSASTSASGAQPAR